MDVGPVHQDLALDASQLAEAWSVAPCPLAIVVRASGSSLCFASVNRHLQQLLQPLRIEPGQLLSDTFEADDVKSLEQALFVRNSCRIEWRLPNASEDEMPCLIKAEAVPGTDPPAFVLMFEASETENAREQRRIEAAAVEQREDFIATLTHDLKTPIVGANMVLAALIDGTLGNLNAEQAQIVGKLLTSNQALLKMIHNILEVYKYESGHETPALEERDLVALVQFSAEEVKPLIENKSQQLHLLLPDHAMKTLCDRNAIQRVLINLLGNAVKFTPSNGSITVELNESKQHSIIRITDTGSGINPRDQHRLFQRFWQGEPGKRYAAGTGLGLYFCYQVVRAHGGNITCESEVGVGSTFTVTLPKRSQ
jgi:signal transduction histidine kinase